MASERLRTRVNRRSFDPDGYLERRVWSTSFREDLPHLIAPSHFASLGIENHSFLSLHSPAALSPFHCTSVRYIDALATSTLKNGRRSFRVSIPSAQLQNPVIGSRNRQVP